MGREQALPASLARLSSRQTPAVSIGCVAVLALVLALPLTYADGGARTFGYLAGAGGLSIVLIYLAVNIAAIRAFRTEFRESSGSGGICSSRQRPPYCSCFCGGSHRMRTHGGPLPYAALGWLCLGAIAAGVLRARRRQASRRWAEYSCPHRQPRGPSRPAGVDIHLTAARRHVTLTNPQLAARARPARVAAARPPRRAPAATKEVRDE